MIRQQATVRAMSKKQMKEHYGVSYGVLASWLEPHVDSIGAYAGGAYTPRQVGLIFDRIGE